MENIPDSSHAGIQDAQGCSLVENISDCLGEGPHPTLLRRHAGGCLRGPHGSSQRASLFSIQDAQGCSLVENIPDASVKGGSLVENIPYAFVRVRTLPH